MLIYDNVKTRCVDRHLSIRRLEIMCGLGNGTVGTWRKSVPRISTLQAVANALDVDIMELIAGDERIPLHDKART